MCSEKFFFIWNCIKGNVWKIILIFIGNVGTERE